MRWCKYSPAPVKIVSQNSAGWSGPFDYYYGGGQNATGVVSPDVLFNRAAHDMLNPTLNRTLRPAYSVYYTIRSPNSKQTYKCIVIGNNSRF